MVIGRDSHETLDCTYNAVVLAMVLVSAQPVDLLVAGTAVVDLLAVGAVVRATDAAHFAHAHRRWYGVLANGIVGRLIAVERIGARQLAAECHDCSAQPQDACMSNISNKTGVLKCTLTLSSSPASTTRSCTQTRTVCDGNNARCRPGTHTPDTGTPSPPGTCGT